MTWSENVNSLPDKTTMGNAGEGLAPVLGELNKQYPDGGTGEVDAGASSADFLRKAAFARESLKTKEQNNQERQQ